MLDELIDNDWTWPIFNRQESEEEFVRAYVPEFPGLPFEVAVQQAEMMDIVAANSLLRSLTDEEIY